MAVRFIIITLLLSKSIFSFAQQSKVDSLRKELSNAKTEETKLEKIRQIGQEYVNAVKLDSAIYTAQEALEFVQRSNLPVKYEMWQYSNLEYLTSITGDYSRSMYYANRALELSERENDNMQAAFAYSAIAAAHAGLGDLRKGLDYYFKAKREFEISESGHWAIQNIAETYLKMHMLDSALYYNQVAYYIADTGHNQQYMKDFAIRVFASIYAEQGNDDSAMIYYRQFASDFYQYNLNNREIDRVYFGMAQLHKKNNRVDSSIFYLEKALVAAQAYNDQEYVFQTASSFYKLYDSLNNQLEAFKYFKIAAAARDSMASLEKVRNMQNLSFNEQIRQKQKKEADKVAAGKRLITISSVSIAVFILSFLAWNRIRQLRLKYKMILDQKESEKLRERYSKELLTLEARALRAQMNPHFIYNCMNSIKSLIQNDDKLHAIEYLTTFSKLIRTLFQNADKRQVSLHDEIETCRLYTQLEAMRLNPKLKYDFCIDANLDLKSVMVPALIVQPFIENAIWHGIVPKNGGAINVSIQGSEEAIICEVDDDGIGREMSKLNRPITPTTHESKGVHLSRQRLTLEKMLNETNASIEILDKHENSRATGTKVILTFNLN